MKRWREWKFCLGELQPFNAFVMLKAVHKSWNLKYDTTEMTAATNEHCIGWLLESCFLMGKNETFDGKRFKSIKGYFFDGGNE